MYKDDLTMNALFAQLGLENSDAAIADFVRSHAGLPSTMKLYQAPFWTQSQAAFLKQAILDDADWCMLIDELDTHLRKDLIK